MKKDKTSALVIAPILPKLRVSWRACFGLSCRHFPLQLATVHYSSTLYIPEIALRIRDMSSASGDEAELALAEPGKKGIPSNCQSVRSIARPLPRQSLVKDVRSARLPSPRDRHFEVASCICTEQYKYFIYLFSETEVGSSPENNSSS